MASKEKKTLALRIGVIQSGRLIEEFIVKDNKPVTLGSTIKNSIIVSANSSIPNKYKLFSTKKDSATLHLLDVMEAEISDGVNKKEYKKQSTTLSLTNKDRGKVKIDENIKVLFQFIEPPEEYFVPHKIPPQFRNKPMDYLDLKFFIPLLVSLFLHVVWVVALQTADYEETILTMDKIPDRFKEVIIQNEPIEKKPKEVQVAKETSKDGEGVKSVKETKKTDTRVKIDKSKMTKSERKAVAKASVKKKSKVISALHKLKSGNGGMGGFGSINDNAGGGDGNEITSLSDIASNSGGAGSGNGYGSGSGDGISGRGSGVGVTGGSGYARSGGGNKKGGPTSLNANIGSERKDLKTKKVKKVAIKKAKLKSVKISGDGKLNQKSAKRAITKAKKRVDGCYQKEAKKNNAFAGRVTVLITVGPGGKPINVAIVDTRMNDAGLAKSLSLCIKKKLKRVRFPKPENPPINVKFTAAFSAGG